MTKTFTAKWVSSQANKLATITYRIWNHLDVAQGPATNAGIYETGDGGYAVDLTFADDFRGTIRWNTGGLDPRYALDPINPDPTIEGGGGGTGDGDIPVDHNFGDQDALQILMNGNPVDNAVIRAYTTESYESGNLASTPPLTRTGSDGRWLAPLMLDPDDYTLVILNPATGITDVQEITVEA